MNLRLLRKSIKEKSLELVTKTGWETCLHDASEVLNLSPAIISTLFPNGPIDLVHDLMNDWNENLQVTFKPQPHFSQYYLFMGTQKRLEFMLPYVSVWNHAMVMGTHPKNVRKTSSLLWNTFDTIWKLSGENEIDTFYPVKRAGLAVAYLTTEVNLIRNPENQTKYFEELESNIIRMCQTGNFIENFYIFSKFALNTNFRVLQSFYPEPRTHENPIIK